MLALHVLAAFALAAALVVFTVVVVGGRAATTLDDVRTLFRVSRLGNPLVIAGTLLVLVLGIVLAIDHEDYQLWDGWIIAAIVLWAVFAGVGARTGKYWDGVQELAESGTAPDSEVLMRLRAPTGLYLHFASLALFLLLLLDMIFKPGA